MYAPFEESLSRDDSKMSVDTDQANKSERIDSGSDESPTQVQSDGDWVQTDEGSSESFTSDANTDDTSGMSEKPPTGNVTQGESEWDADPEPEANTVQGAPNEEMCCADDNSKSIMIPTEKLLDQRVLDEGPRDVVMALTDRGWSNTSINRGLMACDDQTKAVDDLEQGLRDYSIFVVSQEDAKRLKFLIMLDSGSFQHV